MRVDHLRGRISLAAVAVLAGGLVCLTVAMNLLLTRSLDRDAGRVLRERMTTQLDLVTLTGGRVAVHEAAADGALDQLGWVFAGGRELARGAVSAPVEGAVRDLAARATRPTERDGPDRLLLLAQPVLAGRRGPQARAVAVVGLDVEPYQRTERLAVLASVALDVLVLALGVIIARRTVGAALRPVAEMSARAEEWGAHDLARRFALGPPRDEITTLAATLDGLLARLEARLQGEQRLLAELAHELRTPLSGMRAEAELALSERDEAAARAALQRILRRTEAMTTTVETLLVAERSQALAEAASDLADALSMALEVLSPAAAARGVAVAVRSAPGIRVPGAAELVARAVQPVLDNAIRHARRAVTVEVTADAASAVIAVTDDGEGIAAPEREQIFSPGTGDGAGGGLGLPLARRIARSLGGDVAAVPAAGGGARFEIRLPRRPVAATGPVSASRQPSAVRTA